jgi:hypothetical protein
MKTNEDIQKRINITPQRQVIHLDLGNKTPDEALAIVKKWKTSLKKASS